MYNNSYTRMFASSTSINSRSLNITSDTNRNGPCRMNFNLGSVVPLLRLATVDLWIHGVAITKI